MAVANTLRDLYRHLAQRAAATGTDRAQTLRSGARIAVRVRGGATTLTLARRDKPVGDVEITTFRQHCDVPPHATRVPAEGQRTRVADGTTWHYLAFWWEEQPDGIETNAAEIDPAGGGHAATAG
jgi:hypothetical protein